MFKTQKEIERKGFFKILFDCFFMNAFLNKKSFLKNETIYIKNDLCIMWVKEWVCMCCVYAVCIYREWNEEEEENLTTKE